MENNLGRISSLWIVWCKFKKYYEYYYILQRQRLITGMIKINQCHSRSHIRLLIDSFYTHCPKFTTRFPINQACNVLFPLIVIIYLKPKSIHHRIDNYNLCYVKSTRIYTSGKRYGTTATKWHLREFCRYLLFLVVCSIAERNTVDSIDPLRNQIEWPNTVSIVWGPLRLKRRKKVSSGVVTWSKVCLAITIVMLLCSVGFR